MEPIIRKLKTALAKCQMDERKDLGRDGYDDRIAGCMMLQIHEALYLNHIRQYAFTHISATSLILSAVCLSHPGNPVNLRFR